ncbi:contractile injection system protein, VgrG/Pvc8 family [Sphingomonas sp. SUN019]|uniref:phage late control D family protein n=1 Tax=Sphingomonas sp. SUN019 TaxID=2937788 RepID=UPI00216454BD|nr:contractile injection system protein, VgrG/Pvc8 family [Sphingomonas sp. SUN019]UVO51118.1 contractile injection system protein, VgrG/Pvc8 family [Sphingomonas sp. SUN019]
MATAASNVTPLPMRAARPTIEIDGKRVDTLESSLQMMELSDTVEGMAHAALTFGNWGGETSGFQHFDRKTIEFGRPIKVKLGDDLLFEGRISAIVADYPDGGTPTIGVLAEDRLQDLRMTRRTRTFEKASLADVVRTVASDHGLSPKIDLQATTQPYIAQVNQSDLALLHDLARREDAIVWVAGTELHAAKLRPATRVELRWAGSLREFHVEADLASQRTALVATGWNVADKAAATSRATDAAVSSETSSTDGGAKILQAAFGARVDTIAHALPRNGTEARAVAEASFRHMARRFLTAEGVAETKADLRVGATLALTGLGKLFDGDYRATAVTHRFDQAAGMRSEFRCERAGLGRP